MKFVTVVAGLLFLAAPVTAQRHKLASINTETPEGALLQQIGTESDAAKKLELMEQFTTKFPKHEAVGWVYTQMQMAYAKAGQHEKTLAAGEKLVALDPEDVEAGHASLKAGEAKKDPDLIRKWAVITSDAARKVARSAKPSDEEEVEDWKRRVDFSKQVDTYTEYAFYATGLQTADARKRIELFETLIERNPKSQYVAQIQGPYFVALMQAGEKAKAVQAAENAITANTANEEMLLAVANHHYETKNAEKALSYSEALIGFLDAKPKPEGVADADWAKRKNAMQGVAHWMTGVIHSNARRWAQADKSLRTALPLIEDNRPLAAEALFHLGLSNYQIAEASKDTKRILEALNFNTRCAAIASPFQAQARKNIAAIRSQYSIK